MFSRSIAIADPHRSVGPSNGQQDRTPPISLLNRSPAVILLMILFVNMGRTSNADLWGHIRYGQAMLSTGHLVLHDPYSYSAAGHDWRDYEWLSQVVIALLYNSMGVIGLKLWKLACTAGTFVLVALGLAETGASAEIQLYVL